MRKMKTNDLLRAMTLTIVLVCAAVQLNAQEKMLQARLDSTVTRIDGTNSEKVEFAYDEKGNKILEIEYRWNSEQGTWGIADQKTEYTYYDSGKLKTGTCTQRRNEDWSDYRKSELFCDSDGRYAYVIYYTWSDTNDTLDFYEKQVFTYDDKGVATEVIYEWDETSCTWQWDGDCKRELIFDENGNITLSVSYHWNSKTNSWECHWKEEWSYDDKGNCTEHFSGYASGDGTWPSYTSTYENIYDDNGNLAYVYHERETTIYYYSYGDYTEVSKVKIDDDAIERIYDIQGRQRSEMTKGLNIIKRSGRTFKVMK